jgi:adenylate cyclase
MMLPTFVVDALIMRKAVVGIVVGLCAAGVVLAVDWAGNAAAVESGIGPLQTIEAKTYDWRLSATAKPATARRDIALVEIDEYSLRNLERAAGGWPWPRAVHSMLIDYLHRAPAKLIAYDVDFAAADTRRGFDFGDSTWSGTQSDAALVESVKAAGNVLLLANATYNATAGQSVGLRDDDYQLGGADLIERKVIFPPFAALGAAAVGFGHNLFVLDPDGTIRHTVPFVRSGSHVVPSLGVAAAAYASRIAPHDVRIAGEDHEQLAIGPSTMPLSRRFEKTSDGVTAYQWALVNFRGPSVLGDLQTRSYPTYSFFDLETSEEQLLAGVAPKVDPAVFRDKIVFVGTTASGLFDVFETPFAHGRMPGIQVHAAVADDVLSNRFMHPPAAAQRIATVALLAIAIGIVAAVLPAWWATLVTIVVAGGGIWAATYAFSHGYWINLSQPLLAMSLAVFGGVSYQYFVEGREKRRMKKLFGQYVSKDVYEQLVAHPELARLGGQRREMTVLFSDIRGFTTVTEQGRPEDIVTMLNEYFTRMVDVVFRHHGTLDKFVGDMVMALFGAPLDDPQHADHAMEAALDMIEELRALNARWKTEGRYAGLDIGIGINTGPMIAGNIGSDAVMSYTVIGDAVNLGSRLESLNKQYGTRIIISDTTREQLTRRYSMRPLGDVIVKGKTQPVAIFEVTGREGPGTNI